MKISASIIAHSKSSVTGQEIVTFECIYPRYVHSELMTHRVFSRNAASSRAIPIKEMIRLATEERVYPLEWRENQKGMQPGELLSEDRITTCKELWDEAGDFIAQKVQELSEAGLHKQWANRLLEPFQYIKTIVTTTQLDNFFWLRCHADAQIEIQKLANCMYEAYQQSTPEKLEPGEYHTPYVIHARKADGTLVYLTPCETSLADPEEGVTRYAEISSEAAIKISCSCCAQVSYRKLDDSLEKAIELYDRLVTSQPVHASALEHVATPMENVFGEYASEHGLEFFDGVTHHDLEGSAWSGNFKSWVQYRQLIPNHVCSKYERQP